MIHRLIYLHGFASSPRSFKAQYFGYQFAQLGYSLLIPDLNQDAFSELTLTRQVHQAQALIEQDPIPTILIGSSLGGLTAAWVAECCPAVTKLVLLAPAFHFATYWLPKLGTVALSNWQRTGALSVYHHGYQRLCRLNYAFLQDIQQYHDAKIQRELPTLIIHGIHDDVIPVEASREFCETRSWITLEEVESDHSLGDVTDLMWRSFITFLGIA
jgi:predicted esterase YcpF (UPF0227 family)